MAKTQAKFEWWRTETQDAISLERHYEARLVGCRVKPTYSSKWYFHLRASNGKIICQSEAYNSRASCLKGIEAIKRYAADAQVIDITDA